MSDEQDGMFDWGSEGSPEHIGASKQDRIRLQREAREERDRKYRAEKAAREARSAELQQERDEKFAAMRAEHFAPIINQVLNAGIAGVAIGNIDEASVSDALEEIENPYPHIWIGEFEGNAAQAIHHLLGKSLPSHRYFMFKDAYKPNLTLQFDDLSIESSKVQNVMVIQLTKSELLKAKISAIGKQADKHDPVGLQFAQSWLAVQGRKLKQSDEEIKAHLPVLAGTLKTYAEK